MVFRLLTLLAFLFLVYWAMNSLTSRFALTKSQARWLLLLSMALTGIVVLIVLGRLPVQFILAPLGVAVTFLLRALPALLRLMPLWQLVKNRNPFHSRSSADPNEKKSVIRTEFLTMQLHHESGVMDGRVMKGQFEGRQLSDLSPQELMQLARECSSDQDSIQVLEAYLDRMHNNWRDEALHQQDRGDAPEEPAMNRQLALEILGLGENATREDVTGAHRKLMQKMHPDRGGTEYLAKKINAARDYLLQQL